MAQEVHEREDGAEQEKTAANNQASAPNMDTQAAA